MGLFTQLEQLIQQARQEGFEVRFEDLGGRGGGVCEFDGKRWLFIDLAVSTEESWETLQAALTQAITHDTRPIAQSIHIDGGFKSVRKVG